MPKPIREMSETELQARLLKLNPEDIENAVNSQELMLQSLKSTLGKPSTTALMEVTREIDASEGKRPDKSSVTFTATAPQIKDFNVESVLLKMFEIYDSLIEIFQKIGIDSNLSDDLSNQIFAMEKCIEQMGGSVETFIPENFVSGLEMPDNTEMAQKAIETTRKCYKKGNIVKEQVSKDGNTINLILSGESVGKSFVVEGAITAKNGWTGNEAIDYLYKEDGGVMSVKAYEGGKWINISSNFQIEWLLNPKNEEQEELPDFDVKVENEQDEEMKD